VPMNLSMPNMFTAPIYGQNSETSASAGFGGMLASVKMGQTGGFGKITTEKTIAQQAVANERAANSPNSTLLDGIEDIVALSKEAIEKARELKNTSSEPTNAAKMFTSFSDENGVYTAQYGTTSVTQTLSPNAKNAQDTKDATYEITFALADGSTETLSFTDDIRMTTNKDGSVDIYFSESNRTHSYAADGTKTRASGNTLATNASQIVVNITGKDITTGSKSDAIFNFSNNTSISAGGGNDVVFLQGKSVDVNLGMGDNFVYAKTIEAASITARHGRNTVEAENLKNSNISFAAGENILSISQTAESSNISMGGGKIPVAVLQKYREDPLENLSQVNIHTLNDSVLLLQDATSEVNINTVNESSIKEGEQKEAVEDETESLSEMGVYELGFTGDLGLGNSGLIATIDSLNDSSIRAGQSDNNIQISMANNAYVKAGIGDNDLRIGTAHDSAFKLGRGDNDVQVDNLNASSLDLGKGDNRINADTVTNSSIDMGDGDNRVDVQNALMSSLDVGDGNNQIAMNATMMSSVEIGDGNNNLTMDTTMLSSVELGDGDNTIDLEKFTASSLEAGDGNNTLTAENVTKSTMQFGDGDNSIDIENFIESTLLAGDGNNAIDMENVTESAIQVGDGVNTLSVEMLKDSSISYGSGHTTIDVEESEKSSVDKGTSSNLKQVTAMMHRLYTASLAMNEDAKLATAS